MKTHTITTYGIQELSEEAFRNAIDNNRNWLLKCYWWDGTYKDAKMIGLEITSSDTYRNNIEGHLLKGAEEVANLILAEHGKGCDTYKLAKEYLATEATLETADEDCQAEREEEFKDALLDAYLKMLKDEEEYLQTEDALCESFEASETQFLEWGTRAPSYLQ